MEKKKIILIDDRYKLWRLVFDLIIKDMYSQWAELEVLEDITNASIKACYDNNPDALFIQDNELTSQDQNTAGINVIPGIEWIKIYGKERAIILHTGDRSPDIGFKAAQYGAKYYMKKDDPSNSMTNDQMKAQIIEMHKVIIRHLDLVPELIWVVYIKMGMLKDYQEHHSMDPDYVAQIKEDEREL
jgi:hypothetical protein